MAPKPKRVKNKDNARRAKKKISILTQESVDYVDYKDVNLLRRFMSDRAKIRARRVTGNDTQQRGGRDRGGERGIRADGPPPRPSGPPPTGGAEGEELENFEEFEGADEGTAVEEVEA